MKYQKEEKKAFSAKLEKRTKDFAVTIIKTLRYLKQGDEGRIIKNQIFRSATSIGANYRESNRARSKADFRSKVRICEAEASETIYWLEIIDDLDWLTDAKLKSLSSEANQLLAIFSTISKNTK
jgi:four helix bundle protein